MAKEHPTDHDPRRSIELLWGLHEPGKRGPKPRFSTEDVVEAAIAIADREGLAALSMRTVAQAVGVSPMSIYTYVRSKSELLALMVDRVAGELEDAPPGAGWRESLAFMARRRWSMGLERPWLMDAVHHRPPLGPNIIARMEAILRAMEPTGLSDLEKDLMVDVLRAYIEGALHEARDAREAEQRTGLTDAQWFELAEPALQQRLDPRGHAALIRLGEAWRTAPDIDRLTDPTARFEVGLEVVLDGIAAFIARRGGTP